MVTLLDLLVYAFRNAATGRAILVALCEEVYGIRIGIYDGGSSNT